MSVLSLLPTLSQKTNEMVVLLLFHFFFNAMLTVNNKLPNENFTRFAQNDVGIQVNLKVSLTQLSLLHSTLSLYSFPYFFFCNNTPKKQCTQQFKMWNLETKAKMRSKYIEWMCISMDVSVYSKRNCIHGNSINICMLFTCTGFLSFVCFNFQMNQFLFSLFLLVLTLSLAEHLSRFSVFGAKWTEKNNTCHT